MFEQQRNLRRRSLRVLHRLEFYKVCLHTPGYRYTFSKTNQTQWQCTMHVMMHTMRERCPEPQAYYATCKVCHSYLTASCIHLLTKSTDLVSLCFIGRASLTSKSGNNNMRTGSIAHCTDFTGGSQVVGALVMYNTTGL